ncbi:glycoside hydrolase family 16 protein [Micromonospora sp. NBC_01813]|uniref:glycoside hydrolase family 16 protein n=1 Tax=Micromonospora sp. NBC_01813 TaxID=2975988 RepID=UPI002DD99D32|nr:glycoside hydrolase family 16 protein [Micromonospora sp. NBC_01813]WSA10811.1 glycoside hydrolase family 16 protein [Micromonospora sp. NBC_01813]
MTRRHPARVAAAATVVAVVATVALAAAGGTLPSMAAVPTDCQPPGEPWPVGFVDDFDDATLGPNWSVYTGQPSSDPRTRWHRNQVTVRDGALVLSGQPRPDGSGLWFTGGVSNWRQARVYGRWDIRFRAPASPVLSYHFLLWPQAERWPPEIDIIEGFTETRQRAETFVHWVDPDGGGRRRAQFTAQADFTQWRTASVVWTPDAVCFSVDGAPVGAVTGAAVPHEPMWLALQTETQVGGTATGGEHYVEVDQVRISALAAADPGRGGREPLPTSVPAPARAQRTRPTL